MLNQNNDPFNAFEAKTEAQKLSFAPIVFHTARTLRDLGILTALDSAGSKGMSAIDIAEKNRRVRIWCQSAARHGDKCAHCFVGKT